MYIVLNVLHKMDNSNYFIYRIIINELWRVYSPCGYNILQLPPVEMFADILIHEYDINANTL